MISFNSLSRGGRAGLILSLRLGGYLITFLFGICQPKAVLVARVLALQSQLAACKDRIERKKSPKPRFDPGFRLLWVLISRVVDGWDREYLEGYYHRARPHQSLERKPPILRGRPTVTSGPTKNISIPAVRELHHRYERVAA